MKPRIAVLAQNIRQERPRGVARVARAIVEGLAARADFDCYALGSLVLDHGMLIAPHWRLADYLAHLPLDLTRYTAATHPWSLARALGRGPKPLDVGRLESACEPLGIAPLSSFEAILSFEAFEEIWDWPVESLPGKAIVLFHDAIPFRVTEGSHGNPDHFARAVGKCLARADHVVCNSHATERDAHAFFPACEGRTSVIHLGHVPRDPGTAAARRDDRVVITMLGDMDFRKNVQGALRALRLVAEGTRGRRVVLQIIGNHGKRGEFTRLEDEARRWADVIWTGYLPDIERTARLATSDVFLFPSLWEGFGLPILEAMDCGVPVVCSGLSSMPEVGGDHATYIADPYDPRSIAEAVLAALAIPEAQRLVHAAAARAWAARFGWDAAVEKWAALILELVARPKPG